MNKCTVCQIPKPERAFYVRADTGKRRGRCSVCENTARNKRRKTNLRADLAKTVANQAVRDGILVNPLWCESCNEYLPLQKHHEDYSKPLEVEWLCQQCHSRLHIAQKKEFEYA